VLITPVSIGSIGWKTYVYFGVFNACFIPAIYFFCKPVISLAFEDLKLMWSSDPETRNLSLEEVNCLFTGPKIVMHIADAEIDMETMRPPTIKEAEVQRKYSIERIEK
jgi:hypothetical protein